MVRLGEPVQPLARPGQDRLGGLESGSGLEQPGESLRVDAHSQPGRAEGFGLRLGQEVAGVDEGCADGLARVLGG